METQKKIISRNKYFEDINTEKGALLLLKRWTNAIFGRNEKVPKLGTLVSKGLKVRFYSKIQILLSNCDFTLEVKFCC